MLALAEIMDSVTASVYMELGIQAGILLIIDVLKNAQGEKYSHGNEYKDSSYAMLQDIKRALEISGGEKTEESMERRGC